MKNKLPLFALLLLLPILGGISCAAAPRPILVCFDDQASPAIKQAAADLIAHADSIPLIHALRAGGEAGEISEKASGLLLAPKAYATAAHSHLIIIGLGSQDALLAKTWGTTVSIDEKNKQAYSLGFGHLQGDLGWVESDRNPFLHSGRIQSAPEDTVLVKITGTSEAGVLAALRAFEGGLLNGFVPAGPLTRPSTTIIDRDPSAEPAPVTLPASVVAETGPAVFAGWTQVPENEYRAALEQSGAEPRRMWRYKYLAAGMLEERPIIRWFCGVNRQSIGNAVDLLEFASDSEALAAARLMTASGFHVRSDAGHPDKVWEAPWPYSTKAESTHNIHGNTLVTARGPYVVISTLPLEATLKAADSVN